jgi:hypothetical protein
MLSSSARWRQPTLLQGASKSRICLTIKYWRAICKLQIDTVEKSFSLDPAFYLVQCSDAQIKNESLLFGLIATYSAAELRHSWRVLN